MEKVLGRLVEEGEWSLANASRVASTIDIDNAATWTTMRATSSLARSTKRARPGRKTLRRSLGRI